MDTQPQPEALSQEALADIADQQLKSVLQNLKEAKRILARDWEQLSPRERSACARQVKELEQQQKRLLEEIEMNSSL